jgi:type II secretion system protein N
MKQFYYKNRKWFAYFLYCLIVVVALLYYRFPSVVFKDYLESAASEMGDGVNLSINELRLAFPPGMVLTDAKITLGNDPENAVFDAESVSITPELLPLFLGNKKYQFKAKAYGGNLKGFVSLAEGNSAPCIISLKADHLQIQQYALLSRLPEANLKGDLNGDILFKGRFDQIIGGEGEAKLILSEGNMKLGTPFLGVDTIDFGQFTINMNLGSRKIRITRADLKGDTLQGALSGTINLTGDMLRSRLNLKGNIEPLEGFLGGESGNPVILQLFRQKTGSMKRSFSIRGTLGIPKFSFI